MEKLLQPKILTHIPFYPPQHGLRPKHSTCTALSTITADIAAGFSRKNPAHRTVLFALDLTAAFDNQQLLDCVFNTNVPSTIHRWLYNYMQNRRAKVHFRQKESKSRKVKTGVVQGVLFPALFNYYPAGFSTQPPNIKLIKYADDITIYTSGPVVADLINGLNTYLSQVFNYINNNKTDNVCQIYSNTFHTRYSRAPHTSTSEVDRTSTTALKEAKSVRSDVRHPSHLHTTLQQYRSKSATISQQKCNNIAAKVQQYCSKSAVTQ